MPAVRPTSARLLVLTAFLASVLCLPPPPAARARAAACPVAPPVPLRMLFKDSERVVVATAGETASELTDLPAYDGGPKMITLKTTFHVSESFKGDPSETTLVVHQWGGYEHHPADSEFEKGGRRLLFLDRNEENGGYVLDDSRYGAKKLSDDDLKVYVRRINELSAILQKEKPDEAEILEWLVRCAEEKATRWEGAYELSVSVQMLADKAEAEAAQKEEEQGGEEAEAAGEEGDEGAAASAAEEVAEAESATEEAPAAEEAGGEAEQPAEGSDGAGEAEEKFVWLGSYGTDIEPGSASKLSAEQKERLLSALFGAGEVGEGELALIQVAKDSGDERFVPFLVKQLRRMDAEPTYDAHPMVTALAHALKDKTLAELADDYCTNAPYGEFVEEESEESEESSEEGEEERAAARARKEAAAAGKEKVTGAQRRSEMLRAFLAAVDNKIQYDLAMQLSR